MVDLQVICEDVAFWRQIPCTAVTSLGGMCMPGERGQRLTLQTLHCTLSKGSSQRREARRACVCVDAQEQDHDTRVAVKAH
jgi:hypothetical protein